MESGKAHSGPQSPAASVCGGVLGRALEGGGRAVHWGATKASIHSLVAGPAGTLPKGAGLEIAACPGIWREQE